jgi:S1-C subfamily serine protease
MKTAFTLLAFFAAFGSDAVLAQTANAPLNFSTKMEMRGSSATQPGSASIPSSINLSEFGSDIPTNQLSKLAENSVSETGQITRSAKDAEIYRAISPSVILIANKEGIGSGSLLDTSGDILTNWHVVNGYEFVGAIFKPTIEGKRATRDEIKLAHVVKYDAIADLALVKASDVPAGRNPIRLADESEIAVGMDVHAIGHPEGEAWTYTTGVISQYRQDYKWRRVTIKSCTRPISFKRRRPLIRVIQVDRY